MTKKLGLALGSGGARGFAHIGVIQALEDNGINIDYIAGASAGSVIGGMYAATHDINFVYNVWKDIDIKFLFELFGDPVFKSGIIKGKKAVQFLQKHIGKIDIKNLPIKFRAVSTDLQTGESYMHKSGDLATAIRASSSIPILFKPVKIGNRTLIDGGASIPVPVRVIKKMGADVTIAVNLDSVFFSKTKKKFFSKPSTIETLTASLELFRYHLAQENSKSANVIINPNVPDETVINIKNTETVVKMGYDQTLKYIGTIKKLLK